MPHIRFNWVDVLFVILLFRTSYVGFKSGLLLEFLRSLGLLSAFILSFNSYTQVSHFLTVHTTWSNASLDIISFLFIFLAMLCVFKILSMSVKFFLKTENVSNNSKVIGLVLGLGRGLLFISLMYMVLFNTPFEYLKSSLSERSFSGQYVSDIAPMVYRIGINFYPGEQVETPLVRRFM